MNDNFDIGKHKPEELQLRTGYRIVAVYKNNVNDPMCYYTSVIYDGYKFDCVKVAKNGRSFSNQVSNYDVILKPTEIDLKDFIDKPELLQLRNGFKVVQIFKNSDNVESLDFEFSIAYLDDKGSHGFFHTSETGTFEPQEFKIESEFDVILKPQSEPVEKIDELCELCEMWDLFKQYTEKLEDKCIDLRLFHDEYPDLYDSDDEKIYSCGTFKQMIKFLKKEVNNV